MIRINLLPHRELKQKVKREQFTVFAAMTCFIGFMIVWSVHASIVSNLNKQNSRNQFLTDEALIHDKKIEEIKVIKEKSKELLIRRDIVEGLQSSRNEAVHIFDQLIRLLPEGVYINSVKQENKTINIIGYAQSNAWVAMLMRNLESSRWFESPLLIEIKAVSLDDARFNEFNLNVDLVRLLDKHEVEM